VIKQYWYCDFGEFLFGRIPSSPNACAERNCCHRSPGRCRCAQQAYSRGIQER